MVWTCAEEGWTKDAEEDRREGTRVLCYEVFI